MQVKLAMLGAIAVLVVAIPQGVMAHKHGTAGKHVAAATSQHTGGDHGGHAHRRTHSHGSADADGPSSGSPDATPADTQNAGAVFAGRRHRDRPRDIFGRAAAAPSGEFGSHAMNLSGTSLGRKTSWLAALGGGINSDPKKTAVINGTGMQHRR